MLDASWKEEKLPRRPHILALGHKIEQRFLTCNSTCSVCSVEPAAGIFTIAPTSLPT